MKTSLKTRFILFVVAASFASGGLALLFFNQAAQGLIDRLSVRFVEENARKEKNRILGVIRREVALSRKMSDSPLLKKWLKSESDPQIASLAWEEMESYRRAFRDRSFFVANKVTGHYFFKDDSPKFSKNSPITTLSRSNPHDGWFFATLEQYDDFDLNIDLDEALGLKKLWVNMVVWSAGEKIAVLGSGLALDPFIQEHLAGDDGDALRILFDSEGAIQLHPDASVIDENSLHKSAEEQSSIFRLIPSEAERTQLREAMARLTGKGEGGGVEVMPLTLEGGMYLAGLAFIQEIDWHLLILSDFSRVVGYRQFLPLVLALGAGLLMAALATGLLLNRMVLNPMERLTRGAREIAGGRYGVQVPVEEENEIGQLTGAFNLMSATVHASTENLEETVKKRTAQLSAVNKRMTDELDFARLIQDALLPGPASLAAGLRDHCLIWRPRERVGGDFFFLHDGPHGRFLGVADCTGHGVPGALMTMTAHAVLTHVLEETGAEGGPAAVLGAMNRAMREVLKEGGADQVDNGLEMGLCHWRPGEETLTFAGAGIGLFIARSGEVTELKGNRNPLGYRRSDPEFVFDDHPAAFNAGTAFYLVSDGILDQSGGEKGFGFGRSRLKAYLATASGKSLADQGEGLDKLLAAYQGERPQRDDITVVGFAP